MDTKGDITETAKLRSLQCFCGVIPNNFQSGKKLHRCFLLCGYINDEIIPDNDVEIQIST